MKKSIFVIFVVLFALTGTLRAEDICQKMLHNHVDLIESTEEYIYELGENSSHISAFEITQLQKTLTNRFLSLKSLINIYEDEIVNCGPNVLATAVAIYDFSRIGKSIFANKDLRRVVLGFSKYTRYQLTDFVAYYKHYTDNKLIEKTQEKILDSGLVLPEGVAFHRSQLAYDPNLFAISDAAIKGTTSIVAGAARIWGFISDHMKWRNGRLRKDMDARELVRSKLKPLDLIFEKRKFTLSNYTIPGHWGHVAIWLGTKEELITLGVWDQDYFAPFRSFVEAGQNIVEIRKEGLNFQSLESFINLDEIAITRIKNIEERALKVYEGLSEQIDKKYDFKFDARTADRITCAELIAFSYGDVSWHETKTLFQVSLRPDDLASITLDSDSPAEFVLYLKGGSKKNKPFISLGFDQWAKLFDVKHQVPFNPNADQEILANESDEQDAELELAVN